MTILTFDKQLFSNFLTSTQDIIRKAVILISKERILFNQSLNDTSLQPKFGVWSSKF